MKSQFNFNFNFSIFFKDNINFNLINNQIYPLFFVMIFCKLIASKTNRIVNFRLMVYLTAKFRKVFNNYSTSTPNLPNSISPPSCHSKVKKEQLSLQFITCNEVSSYQKAKLYIQGLSIQIVELDQIFPQPPDKILTRQCMFNNNNNTSTNLNIHFNGPVDVSKSSLITILNRPPHTE